jgi:4-nitrophenyl phosphatase
MLSRASSSSIVAGQFGIDGKLGGTLAVLTGVSKKEDFMAEDAPTVPTAYVNALGDLMG